MLSVLLIVLKILGITLLALLGLLLLLTVLVLAVPVRYQLRGRAEEKKYRAKVKIHWLLHLLQAELLWKEKAGLLRIRLCGIRIKTAKIGEFEEEAAPGREDASYGREEAAEPDPEMPRPEEAEAEEAGAEAEAALPEEVQDLAAGPSRRESRAARKAEKKAAAEEKRKETQREEERLKAAAREIPEETVIGVTRSAEEKAAGEEKKAEKESSGQKGRQGLKAKLDSFLAFIRDEKNQKTFALIGRQLKKLGKHLLPTKLQAEGKLGFDDPAKTGRTIGKIYALYPLYGDRIRIEGVYDRAVSDFRAELKGRIRLGIFVRTALRLLTDKNLRRWLKQIRKKDTENTKAAGPAAEPA